MREVTEILQSEYADGLRNAGADMPVAPHHMGWGATDALSRRRLLLVAALNARALEQLAVLLLGHPLAPLLDNRAHDYPRSLLITRLFGRHGPTRPTRG